MSETTSPSVPSLEVNLADIERIASTLDAQADDAVTIGKRTPKKRVAKLKNQPPPAQEESTTQEVVQAPLPIDPEFEAMLTHGSSQLIDLMRDKMELMEPGDTMRENIGKCVAKLVTRLKPMQEGPLAEGVTIAGYLAVWVISGRNWGKKPEAFTVIPPNVGGA